MGENADEFLSSFNRIEKYLKESLNAPTNMGFSEAVRRLSRQKGSIVKKYENDLLEMAQLRNAIIHEKVAENFVIAEPNDWAVSRIKEIDRALIEPEEVYPKFKKNVTGFEKNLPIEDILQIIAQKHFSQFPIYDQGEFLGLITVRGIGFWVAQENQKGPINFQTKTAQDLLDLPFKKPNYRFCATKTPITQVESWFKENPLLEAVLITKDGNPNGNLLGIIRPRDLSFI